MLTGLWGILFRVMDGTFGITATSVPVHPDITAVVTHALEGNCGAMDMQRLDGAASLFRTLSAIGHDRLAIAWGLNWHRRMPAE